MTTTAQPAALTVADLQRFDLLESEGAQRVFLCREVNDDKQQCVRYRILHPMRCEKVQLLERFEEWLSKAKLMRRLPKEFQ